MGRRFGSPKKCWCRAPYAMNVAECEFAANATRPARTAESHAEQLATEERTVLSHEVGTVVTVASQGLHTRTTSKALLCL